MDLKDWRLVHRADGLVLVPPDGIAGGGVRIRELQQPLRSAAAIFAEATRGTTFVGGSIERLQTQDGEYAAFQVQRSSDAVRCLGAVFGDHAYTLIDASTSVATSFAMIEHVARTCVFQCALGLGHRRHRRFLYSPPVGWSGVAHGLATRWTPPRYPADDAVLVTHPAEPAVPPSAVRDAVLARLRLSGWKERSVSPSRRRFTDGDLAGVAWDAVGSRGDADSLLHVVVLEDERFVYPIELVCSAAQAEVISPVLDAVVRSARPIPLPEALPRVDAMLHWAL